MISIQSVKVFDMEASNGKLSFVVPTQTNKVYEIYKTTDLNNSRWRMIKKINGNGRGILVTDDIGNNKAAFYTAGER